MKNYLKVIYFLFFTINTYSQWIESPLPKTVDVWGLANKDTVIFAGTEIGSQQPGYVFRSVDFGTSWDILTSLPFAGGWSFAFSDSILVAGSFGWGIYLSSDLGSTWAISDSGIASDENVHVVLKHKSYVFAATADSGNGILRSSDNGYSWIEVNTGLPQFSSFISLASNGEDIYTTSIGEVFRSTDDGMNWFSISNGLQNVSILSLATQGSKVYAGTFGSGVYFSNDRGENWTNISGGVPPLEIWSLVLADTSLFVATNGSGVYLTQDDGVSWTWVSEGLTTLYVRSLLVTTNNYLFAGTANGLVCKRPLYEMITSVRKQINSLSKYSLSQNYPNPFNPNTTIRYSLPQSSNVVIKIFDVLGNEIETIVNEEKPVGTYEITYYAENLPSGVYFYQLKAGDYIETKKMILMK